MPEETSILISTYSLSSQLKDELVSAITSLSKDGKLFQFNDLQNISSHLLIIDVDDEAGLKRLQSSLPGQVKILISSDPQPGKNIVGLKKPVDIHQFKNILRKLYVTMHAQLSRMNASKQKNEEGVSDTVVPVYNIVDSVFYHLLIAKNNKTILSIASKELDVYIDGNNQTLKTSGSLDDVRQLLSIPYNQINIQEISEEVFESQTSKLQIVTLHNILWAAAITCSHGQLLPEQDNTLPVKLRAWPSFTRNDFKPEHLKLAAILAQRPVSLADLAQQTSIDYSEIVNFYNAAFAVGLIDKHTATEVVEPVRQGIDKKKSNLLNKIASRLGFGHRVNGTYNG